MIDREQECTEPTGRGSDDDPRCLAAPAGGIPESVELESCPCPIGCDAGDRVVLQGRDLLHRLPGEYRVVACNGCGLMRTNPRPTGETIGFYYPDDYGPYIGTRIGEGSSEAKVATGISSIIRKVFSQEGNRIPKMAPGRLLEIGSASGKYLCQMEQLGWAVRGIEFSEHAASHARAAGLDVHTGTIESAPDPEQPYDLVVGWMVLEHLHDPVAALRRLHSWTRPEGRMVLSVPNASCWSFKLFKSNWYDLHLPNHLFHFTPRTLQRLLAQAGWELQTIHYQQNFATPIASLGYWLAERQVLADFASSLIGFPTGGSRWSYRAALPLAMVEALFRQSSRMTVWVRPRCNG